MIRLILKKDEVVSTLAFRGDDDDIEEEADKLGAKTIFAKITGIAEADFTKDNAPGALAFFTGDPIGDSVKERVRIDKDGLVTIKEQIKIAGGSPGADKVLTSNANGLATWEEVSGTSDTDWDIDGDNVLQKRWQGWYRHRQPRNPPHLQSRHYQSRWHYLRY